MSVSSTTRNFARLAFFCVSMVACSLPVSAFELLMVEQSICPFCKRFDAEVNYTKSATGKRLPLRRIQLNDPWPDDLSGIPHDMLTPTFILVQNGEELGRLRGYPGKEQFWFLLNKLIEEKGIQIN